MTSLSTTILIITGFLVIFILLCVIEMAQYEDFNKRINALKLSSIKLELIYKNSFLHW
jgi:hypothetical protein